MEAEATEAEATEEAPTVQRVTFSAVTGAVTISQVMALPDTVLLDDTSLSTVVMVWLAIVLPVTALVAIAILLA